MPGEGRGGSLELPLLTRPVFQLGPVDRAVLVTGLGHRVVVLEDARQWPLLVGVSRVELRAALDAGLSHCVGVL